MNSYLWSHDVRYFHQFVIDISIFNVSVCRSWYDWHDWSRQHFGLSAFGVSKFGFDNDFIVLKFGIVDIEKNQSSDDSKISAEHTVSFPSKSIDFGPKTMCHVAGKLVRREILASANYSKSSRSLVNGQFILFIHGLISKFYKCILGIVTVNTRKARYIYIYILIYFNVLFCESRTIQFVD